MLEPHCYELPPPPVLFLTFINASGDVGGSGNAGTGEEEGKPGFNPTGSVTGRLLLLLLNSAAPIWTCYDGHYPYPFCLPLLHLPFDTSF